jgi:hypothetical protein
VRVIDRVHDLATHARTTATPARRTGLAERQQLVLGVADLADRRQAVPVDEPHLGRRHAKRHVVAFLRDDLRRHPGRPTHLAALPDLELDVVHRRTQRDLAQGHRIARPHVRTRTRDDSVTLLQPLWLQDVALLAVVVLHEGDARRAVRIVLDLLDDRADAVLVALEVDDPVLPLVTAATTPHRDVAVVVATGRLGERLDERLLRRGARDLAEIRHRAESRALGHRLELTNSHCDQPSNTGIVSPSRSFTIAFFQFGRRPVVRPMRFSLPRWFDVHTPVTLTPNSCSTAVRICGFVASGWTSNAYSPRS